MHNKKNIVSRKKKKRKLKIHRHILNSAHLGYFMYSCLWQTIGLDFSSKDFPSACFKIL